MNPPPQQAPAFSDAGTIEALPARPAADPSELARILNAVGPGAIAVAVAATVALSAEHEGAYYVDVWGPLGLILLAACAAVVVALRAPSRLALVGSGALLALGGWAVLSTQWGGIPNAAWTLLDQSIIGAAALIVGSALASGTRGRTAVYAGVFLGLTGHAAWILVRVFADGGPSSWYYQRYLEGPVGYHNAQATLFALGVPLAVGAATSSRLPARMAGGASLGPLLGALILTQSRGGLLAAGAATVVLLAWARDLRLFLYALPVLAATGSLLLAVRKVDAALVDGGGPGAHVSELRHYVAWCALAALALAAVAAASVPSRLGRRAALAVAVITIAAGSAVALANTGAIERGIDRVTGGVSDDSPDTAPAGATRLASLSLNGRRQAWRFAWDMARDHPVAGAGMGSFSREWGTDRTVQYLYILQPHSLELELLGELGIVGFGLFVVLIASAFGCVAVGGAGRRRAAMAAAVIVALLTEVSVDWTWSFPAVVVSALLVVGAAGGGGRLRWQRVSSAAAVPVLAAAAVALGLPFLADRDLDRGRALAADNPSRAWTLSVDSRKLNPWDERVYALQGRLAGDSGLSNLVVEKYDKAASLSRQPWHAYFQEAASLDPKDVKAVRRACHLARAADPLEPAFDYGPCREVR